jgi:hypothetical protein
MAAQAAETSGRPSRRFHMNGFGWSLFNVGAGMMAGLSLARLNTVWPMLVASLGVVVGFWLVALSMKRNDRKGGGVGLASASGIPR